jgi:hypothetical protein
MFNRLLPIARAIEKVPGLPAQSLIMVGRKPVGASVRIARNASDPAPTELTPS